jgi:hypothetical protein
MSGLRRELDKTRCPSKLIDMFYQNKKGLNKLKNLLMLVTLLDGNVAVYY